jgi:hypothetical protein
MHRIKTIFVFSASMCLTAVLNPLMLHGEEFEDQTQKTFQVHTGGTLIFAADGPVTVVPGDDQTVTIQMDRKVTAASASQARQILDRLEIKASQHGNTIHYLAFFKPGWPADGSELGESRSDEDCVPRTWKLHQMDFMITVPRQFSVHVNTLGGQVHVGDIAGNLRVRDVGGSLTLGNIGGSVYAETGGGHIDLLSSNGNADLRTGGGFIHAGAVNGDAKVFTRGGAIRLERARGNVEAETNSSSVVVEAGGSIHAKIAGQPKSDSYFKTAAGAITVELAPEIKATIDAYGKLYTGRMDSDFALTVKTFAREELKGDINGGGPAIVIPDGSGSIHIRRSSM